MNMKGEVFFNCYLILMFGYTRILTICSKCAFFNPEPPYMLIGLEEGG